MWGRMGGGDFFFLGGGFLSTILVVMKFITSSFLLHLWEFVHFLPQESLQLINSADIKLGEAPLLAPVNVTT